VFAGDNFFRYSGEAPEVQKLQLFAWQAAARGNDVHLNANPTQGELLHQEYRQKKEKLKDTSKVSILERYGGEEYLEKAPKELLRGQTEEYVEYSRTGQVVKGRERVKAKSKYPEDGMHVSLPRVHLALLTLVSVLVNNHTAVWGSWYDTSTGAWGYACCHSIIHVSYCSGEAGIQAALASSAQHLLASTSAASAERPSKTFGEGRGEKSDESGEKIEQNYSKKRVGEGDVKLDKERLAQAIDDERKRKMRGEDDDDRLGKKRKGALGGGSHDVTEEELGMFCCDYSSVWRTHYFTEAYRMNRRMTEDPMANYVDTEV
jgi:pre-mRNA-processing factor SLU7